MTNLYLDVPQTLSTERFDVLVQTRTLRLERIVSLGHATAPGEWLDQERAEWVLVLRGRAGLRFADEAEPRVLGPGDHVHIAARRPHRVEWTDAGAPTIWLALHYD